MRYGRFDLQLRRSRIALYTVLPLAALASAGIMETVQPALRLIYILLGFSLIIFLHELGHFVVARLCAVKCLAFSIGIGPRMCGWRKNGRLSFGPDPYDPDNKKDKLINSLAAEALLDKPLDPNNARAIPAATTPAAPSALGDCDYRLSWLPLGGYVRMLGQDDMDPSKVSNDPHAFNRRPIWQRMCIVSAGVIMNVIFAAVCFSIIFSPGIGVDFPPAIVGQVAYDMPAWGQLNMGDRIVSIDGEKPRGFLEFTDVMMAAALSDGNRPIRLDYVQYGTGKLESKELTPKVSDVSGFLAFGIEAMPGLKIGGKADEYINADAEKAGRNQVTFDANKPELAKLGDGGWRITAIDGIDLRDAPEPNATHDKYVLLNKQTNAQNGKPVTLSLENPKTKATQQITLVPHIEPVPGASKFPAVFGLEPQLLASEPAPKSPAAKAGFKEGDRILRVGERTAPDMDQFKDIVSHSDGRPLEIIVERAGEMKTITVTGQRKAGLTLIGLPYYQDLRSARFVADGAADSEARALDLDSKASIAAIDGQPVANWQDIYAALRTKNPDAQVKVTFNTTAGTVDHAFTLTQADSDLVRTHLHFMLGLHLENETKTQKADNAGQAALMGLDHTKKFILNVYMTLMGLARRTVDPSNLHGIVGITKIGYDVQERGPVWLWYVLAMVSVNLAVANFLPLPIVDGGLFLLLILEKIRGKPLPLKVQTAIQTVGIVLLASLFLYVTMNDINLFR